jgi:hypothetical protein
MIVESTSNFPQVLKRTSPTLRWLILALLAVVVLASGLMGQVRGFGGSPHAGSGFGRGVTVAARNQPFGSRGFYLGDTPFFYSDYPFGGFAAQPASPQVIVVRSLADAPQETKSEPLLIELRGDKYVRFGGVQRSGERGITAPPYYADETSATSPASTESGAHSRTHPQATATPKPRELPPVVLIYRDGHREEVSDYAIVGAVMYARGDYWQNGYWTKDIQLSVLNIPATTKANQDHGVKFALPGSPNEIVTRP